MELKASIELTAVHFAEVMCVSMAFAVDDFSQTPATVIFDASNTTDSVIVSFSISDDVLHEAVAEGFLLVIVQGTPQSTFGESLLDEFTGTLLVRIINDDGMFPEIVVYGLYE